MVEIPARTGVLIVNQPEDQFVSVNGTLRLTFNVSSTRPISYQWSKDGRQLQDDGRVNGSNASVLMVDPVEGDDFGGYRCNASNDVDQVLSDMAMVAVSPNGTVVVTPARQTLSVNDGVNFSCTAEGGPSNVFQWSLGDANLTGENGTFLNITNMDAANGGNYTCTVRNRAGVEQDTAELFVNPILLEEPVDTNISLFGNGVLTCRARGFPTPEVSWYQNGTRLDAAAVGKVSITAVMMNRDTTSTLTITNATFDHSGRYFCSVTSSDPNVIMVNSSEVDVTVRHTPEQPVNVTVTDVTPFSVALSWVEPHDNNALINDYIITIDSVGTKQTLVQTNASVEAFNVTGLLPFVNYTFTVAAENDEGVGLASTPVERRTLEFFPSAPLNLALSAVGPRSINLTWSPPANPNGVLLFYQLEYFIEGSSDLLALDVPAESLAASLEDLTPARQYRVTVRANTSVGFGDRSANVTATPVVDVSRSISQESSEESIEGKHSSKELAVKLSHSLQPFGLQYVWQRISCGREDFVQQYCSSRKLLGNSVEDAHEAWYTLRERRSVHPVIEACALSFSVISTPENTAYLKEHWLDLSHQMDRSTPDHRMVRYMCEYALAWAMWYEDLDTTLATVKAGYTDMKTLHPENFFLAPYYTVTIGRWMYEAKARNGDMTYNDITEIRKYADETFRLITTLEDKWARIDAFGAKLSALHLLLLVANYCYGHPDDFPEIYEPLCLRIDSLYKEISEEYNELQKHSGIVLYDQAWFHSVSATYHLLARNTATTQEDKDRLYSLAQRYIAVSARLYDRNGRWWRSQEEAKRGDDPDSIREYAKREQSAPHI